MPSATPADPVVEEDRVCPECGSEHLVRDYARGELVCDSCGLVGSESAIDEEREWGARRRRRVRGLPERRGPPHSGRTPAGHGRPEEDDRKGVWGPPAVPHPPRSAVPPRGLCQPLLLPARPEQHGGGGSQQDPQGA